MHELLLLLNSQNLGGFRTAGRSYLRGAWEIVKDTNAATSGAWEVEQGRFQRKLYLRVAGMSLGGQREAGSAHTTAARKKGWDTLPRQRCLGENGKAR